jgi:hypothetical protein
MSTVTFSTQEPVWRVGSFYAKGNTLCILIETADANYNLVDLSDGSLMHCNDCSDIEFAVDGFQLVTSQITINPE